MEVVDQEGNANCNIYVVLDKWKQDFSSLYNCSFIDNDSVIYIVVICMLQLGWNGLLLN